jgi:hypothetical protein
MKLYQSKDRTIKHFTTVTNSIVPLTLIHLLLARLEPS